MQMALRALIVKTKRLGKSPQFPWGGFESLYVRRTMGSFQPNSISKRLNWENETMQNFSEITVTCI